MGSLKKAAKNAPGNRQRWDESFKNDIWTIPSKAARARLYNEVTTVPMHWIEFFSQKKKEKSGYYDLCLNWDFDNEQYAEKGCPMCAAGLRVTSYTYAYLIVRAEQRKGNLQIRPVRLTPKCVNDIIKLSEIAYEDGSPEGWDDSDGPPDATDPKFGFDIMISRTENNGKTEYPVHCAEGGKVPLSKDELRAFKAYAEEVNFSALAKAGLPPKAEAEANLVRLGIVEGSGSSKKRSDEDYQNYDDVPDDGDDGDDDDPVITAQPKKPKVPSGGKKPERRTSLTDDEAPRNGKGGKRTLPWDDDDGESETSYATPDEDDVPEADDEE